MPAPKSRQEFSAAAITPSDRFEAQWVVYSWNNVDVLVWLSPATQPGVDRMHLYVPRRYQALGTKFSVVHVMMMGTSMPDSVGRSALAQLVTRWSEQLGPMVTIIEQDGFLGSAIRAMATGILLMSSQHTTMRIVASAEEAVAWLPARHLALTGVAIDAAELLEVLLAVRSAHASPTSADLGASV